MQVILLEKITHLGELGDIVKVKDGYARNYLIPTVLRKPLLPNSNNVVLNLKRLRPNASPLLKRSLPS